MITSLFALQYPFLFITQIMLGFAIYGSDFGKGASGYIYLSFFAMLTGLSVYFKKRELPLYGWVIRIFYLIGALCSLFVFKHTLKTYWDEHSAVQAILVAGTGLCSWVLAKRVQPTAQQVSRRYWSLAFVIISLVWLFACVYPMFGFFTLSVLFFAAFVFCGGDKPDDSRIKFYCLKPYWLIPIIGIELSIGIWDQGIDSNALSVLFFGFAGAAFILIKPFARLTDTMPLVVLALLVLVPGLSTLALPSVILSPFYAITCGLLLGAVLNHLLANERGRLSLQRTATMWMLGLLLGFFFYSNLSYVNSRLLIEVFIGLLIAGTEFLKHSNVMSRQSYV